MKKQGKEGEVENFTIQTNIFVYYTLSMPNKYFSFNFFLASLLIIWLTRE